MRPRFQLLDEDLVDRIITDAALVLSGIGVEVNDHGVRELLAAHGAEIGDGDGRVRLGETMVEAALVSSDVPEAVSDSYRLFINLLYCGKAVVTGAFTIEGFAVMRELLLTVRGTAEALAARPPALFTCCPTSPLRWTDEGVRNLVDCARSGIPVEIVPVPLTGFMAPVTLVGTLIQHTAEVLSGVVIAQLAQPGAPLLEELLAEKHLLIADHTRRHLSAELCFPGPVIDRTSRPRWLEEGGRTLGERAAAEVDLLLADAAPSPLDEDARRGLEVIMAAAARTAGMDKLPAREA